LRVSITDTDLEVELVASTDVTVLDGGDITVPGRKFLDILRALQEKVAVSLSVEAEKIVIKAGPSRFSLSWGRGVRCQFGCSAPGHRSVRFSDYWTARLARTNDNPQRCLVR
jgi:hypothetical protein